MQKVWLDTIGKSEKLYAVWINREVLELYFLITADTSDRVSYPTCVSTSNRVEVSPSPTLRGRKEPPLPIETTLLLVKGPDPGMIS
jgi:hypothetical protein